MWICFDKVIPLEKCLIALIKLNKELVVGFAKNPNISEEILRNTNYDDLKMKMNFEIVQEKREGLLR